MGGGVVCTVIFVSNPTVVLCWGWGFDKTVCTSLKRKVALCLHLFVHRSAPKWLLRLKTRKEAEFCRNIVNIFYSYIYLFKKLV